MNKTRFAVKIQHPEWLSSSKPQDSIRLYLEGKMPATIAGWCIVVGLKHPLCAVYGSDFKAARALLYQALQDKWENRITEPSTRLWYHVPFAYAWVWTFFASKLTKYPVWGRRESPEAIRCEMCGWAGMRRWAIHGYQDDGSGQDVEPADECPRCGDEV
jgi:hypothetical protein